MYFQSYVFGYCSCIFILIVSNIVGFALIWERWFVWTTIVFVQLDWNHRYHLVSPLNLSQSIPIQISCHEKKNFVVWKRGWNPTMFKLDCYLIQEKETPFINPPWFDGIGGCPLTSRTFKALGSQEGWRTMYCWWDSPLIAGSTG